MAVYTDVTDQTLRGFVQQYAIGEITSFKGIAEGVENSNYLLKTTPHYQSCYGVMEC